MFPAEVSQDPVDDGDVPEFGSWPHTSASPPSDAGNTHGVARTHATTEIGMSPDGTTRDDGDRCVSPERPLASRDPVRGTETSAEAESRAECARHLENDVS